MFTFFFVMQQLEESKAEANAAVIVSLLPSVIGDSTDINLKAMKDREIELVGAKVKARKNEEVRLISSKSELRLTPLLSCSCSQQSKAPFNVKSAWIYLKDHSRTLYIRHKFSCHQTKINHSLNPCGHVLCLSCLQEWFRKAPPALDDMDVDPDELTDPQYVLMRSKTCPSCRAVVKHPPVPIFMVKSVVAAIKKIKSPHNCSPGIRRNDDNLDDNPWKGIFTSSEGEADDDEEGDDDDDESQAESDSDDFGDWYRHSHRTHFEAAVEGNATSESEMENEEDEDEDENEDDNEDDDDDDGILYTHQRWAPPTVSISNYHIEGEDDLPNWGKLFQRGCSWDMLHNFDVSYSHGSGIVVTLRSLEHLYASGEEDEDDNSDDISMYHVFLGWNISLDPDDTDGENYIQEILREIKEVPERWEVTPTPGMPFAIDARRLVDVDEAVEFDTTDTDEWIDNEEDL